MRSYSRQLENSTCLQKKEQVTQMTPFQARAARASLDLSTREVADSARVSHSSVAKLESGAGGVKASTIEVIRRVYDKHRIIFHGDGAQIAKQPPTEDEVKNILSSVHPSLYVLFIEFLEGRVEIWGIEDDYKSRQRYAYARLSQALLSIELNSHGIVFWHEMNPDHIVHTCLNSLYLSMSHWLSYIDDRFHPEHPPESLCLTMFSDASITARTGGE